ncbi:hypothetical protein BDN67DRAFT_964390 [Paxillus ammoniavirescens]|nr:hypothetical protein BDN67DRAFT_964390 [Paxillus ammoniavirescens]
MLVGSNRCARLYACVSPYLNHPAMYEHRGILVASATTKWRMSILGFLRKFIAFAVEFVTQRKPWEDQPNRRYRGEGQYTEFSRSWSTRAERGIQERDYMTRINQERLGGGTHWRGVQIQDQWQEPPKYQNEDAGLQRTTRRRFMVVSNPDPPDESDTEVEMMN